MTKKIPQRLTDLHFYIFVEPALKFAKIITIYYFCESIIKLLYPRAVLSTLPDIKRTLINSKKFKITNINKKAMKKISKLMLLIVAMICGSLVGVNAQTAAEVEATNKKMMAASTACNQGTEPFKNFIAKFSTDKEFMESRIKLSAEQREKYAAELVPETFTAKTPFAKDGDEWYQDWGELQYNKTYLECGWVDSYVEYIFVFERKDGKWYLSDVVI